jgi:hypothetical protein
LTRSPALTLVELFAFLDESLLFRANQIIRLFDLRG